MDTHEKPNRYQEMAQKRWKNTSPEKKKAHLEKMMKGQQLYRERVKRLLEAAS